MASTSLSLGPHWEAYIAAKIESGRYGTVSEVVRDALRQMEERDQKLEALRAQIALGLQQARDGHFAEDNTLDGLLRELDGE